MGIKLDINLDEFEKSLTPEVLENAFYNAGFDVELKEEYKTQKEEQKEKRGVNNVSGI